MKKYRLCAMAVICALLFAGCGNAGDEAEVSGASQVIKDPVYTVFVDSTVPSGELDEKGYITTTDSTEYADANENLNFDLKLSLNGVDSNVTELAKAFQFNGNSYNLTYKDSIVYEPLSPDIQAFSKDKAYDEYVFNEGKDDEVKITYNRDTGNIYKIAFTPKEIEPDGKFTHKMAIAAAEKLIDSFLGENNARTFEFSGVQDVKQKTEFIEVMYIRTISGYETEQILLVDFNYDGSLKSISYGKLGFFSNSKCQISALDHYEKLLSEELIKSAENELKKIIPEEVFDKCNMIIGFDSDGNCLLHTAYLFEDKTLVKYYVNLFELSEETDVVAK